MLDSSMTLPDGRVLAYTDCGAPNGPVVLYCHGTPTSRLDLTPFDDDFVALGVRVVSPDRPSFGGSSPQPGRTWNDWPRDVAALADHLGVGRFAVMGLSSGGPYTVACAALLGERVAAAAVVGGVTDMGWPDAWAGIDETRTTVMRLGDEVAAAAWCEERFGADGSRFFEHVGDLPPADTALFTGEATASVLFTTAGEAFRQGVVAYAQDFTVEGTPWSFDPGAITAPTTVLHGNADTLVPIAHGRHTAALIPGASFVVLPEHGHLSPMLETPRLAADLAGALT
jgi:pimeloyl-ACP methyl ester carboxylesterase